MQEQSEKNAIGIFLHCSPAFKSMQKDSFSGRCCDIKQTLIQELKKATTFSEMVLRLNEEINERIPELVEGSIVNKACIKTLLFFGGYVDSDADFAYHLPVLIDEIIDYAMDYDYELNTIKAPPAGM